MRRILWFRRDLRIEDNPLLSQGNDVLPIFIFDTEILSKLSSDDRRITFIFNAVIALKQSLHTIGLDLAIFYGKPSDVFRSILKTMSFDEVCGSGDYDSYAISRDRDISHLLEFNYLHDTYIFRPDEVLKNDGTPYLVFTPFYNRSKAILKPHHMIKYEYASHTLIPYDYENLHVVTDDNVNKNEISLPSLGFIAQILTPHQLLSPGQKLERFASKLSDYQKDRDYLALDASSGLSADLRFGTISIRALMRWLRDQKKRGIDTEPFFRQLIFRDFYAMLLYHFPHLSTQNFRYRFRGEENEEYFHAFCNAQTGVAIVDAGVRQLLETGEMHNRVRMIVASFFTKNLLLPWQWGETFFARYLLDYDASSNILSWQWSAGTGVDPQPYFRIFNPTTQAEKFDKNGAYVRKHLPNDYHIEPIVDHKESSKKALEYFKKSL